VHAAESSLPDRNLTATGSKTEQAPSQDSISSQSTIATGTFCWASAGVAPTSTTITVAVVATNLFKAFPLF
jgi:hypothetical protein